MRQVSGDMRADGRRDKATALSNSSLQTWFSCSVWDRRHSRWVCTQHSS